MNRAILAIASIFRRFNHPNLRETRQLVWIILVLLLIAAVAANDLPSTAPAQTPVVTPSTTVMAAYPAPTPTPTLVVPFQNETDGMIIGGVVLVMIIIGGTLQVLRPRANE